MSHPVFSVMFIAAAALLAMWTVVRFPQWAPSEIRAGMIHIGVSMVGMNIAVPILERAVALLGQPYQGLLGVIAILLPVFVYRLITTIWMLRLVQGSLGSAIR